MCNLSLTSWMIMTVCSVKANSKKWMAAGSGHYVPAVHNGGAVHAEEDCEHRGSAVTTDNFYIYIYIYRKLHIQIPRLSSKHRSHLPSKRTLSSHSEVDRPSA